MLNELENLQEGSDESVWGAPSVSFTIQTREPIDGELIQRKYTFTHATEWDKWTFFQYEESRTDDTTMVSDRNWRREKKLHWDEPRPLPEIPPEVNDELKELLGLDELNIQTQ